MSVVEISTELVRYRLKLLEHEVFFRSLVNSFTDQLVVVDGSGAILFVNEAWIEFNRKNGGKKHRLEDWQLTNLLDVLDKCTKDVKAQQSAIGIRDVLEGRKDTFEQEYPCHSAHQRQWFLMKATVLKGVPFRSVVITHHNITARKLAEQKISEMALTDELTGLANRRRYDQVMAEQSERCANESQPLSVVLIDVDNFKLFNDTFGHLAGDDCLRTVSECLEQFQIREQRLIARYGGEEFVLVMAGEDAKAAARVANKIVSAVSALSIPHADSNFSPSVTVSAGVATVDRLHEKRPDFSIFELADRALYQAKEKGKNQVQAWFEGFDSKPPVFNRDNASNAAAVVSRVAEKEVQRLFGGDQFAF